MERTVQKLTSQTIYYSKFAAGFATWAGPGVVLGSWLAWPALTPEFKKETLGLSGSSSPSGAPAGGSPVFRGGGKYKYVKSEIGERPTLEEE